MHLFDLKTILLEKHAQHVVLIHFPIALLMMGVTFDLLARWRSKKSLGDAAYYNFTAAALFTVPTIATGLIAWQWQFEGARLRGNLRLHLLLALTSTILIWAVWMLHFLRRRTGGPDNSSATLVGVELLAVVCIAMTAHIGGILSGINTSIIASGQNH